MRFGVACGVLLLGEATYMFGEQKPPNRQCRDKIKDAHWRHIAIRLMSVSLTSSTTQVRRIMKHDMEIPEASMTQLLILIINNPIVR